MLDFRRGASEITKANEAAQSGGNAGFRPFIQNFFWKDDGDQKFLLILNPLEDIPMVTMHPKVWTEGRPRQVIARTDPAIGEAKDPIEEQWDYAPQDLNVCVAVELEAQLEAVRGRPRPVGFTVKTRSFDRRIRDDDGELTDETEEVTAPEVGLIAQSPNNFFNHISSKDATVAPINEVAICVTRVGKDRNTDYEVDAFDREELDLSDLFEYVENISYLNEEESEALLKEIAEAENDTDAAAAIGSVLLDKRLSEMAGEEYYNEVLEAITEPARYGKKSKGKKGKDKPATQRQQRPSQRRGSKSEAPAEPEAEASAPEAEEPEVEEPKPRRSSRRSSGPKPAAKAKETTKAAPVRERLEALREATRAAA